MISIFGVQISTYHSLLVALHTGTAVLASLTLAARLVTDILFRGKEPTERVVFIRRESDLFAYFLALFSVVFICFSAMTGYLIEPYSVLSTTPILLNKSIVALGALYFWAAFCFIRYWQGPRLWDRAGLYALAFGTAQTAMVFTTIAGSLGGELSPFGQSVLDPVYRTLGINVRALTLTQVDVYITAVLMAGLVVVTGVLSSRWRR